MKPSVRSLFLGVAIAFFFTLTLAALAQEKPAATAAPAAEAPAAEARPLRRLDEPTVEKTDEAPAAPTKAKKTRAQQAKERAEAAKQRAIERAALGETHTGEAVVNVFADSILEKGKKADAVVAVFGNATSEGDVVDAVVSVFGDNRVTGSVGAASVAVFGNNYVNSSVAEAVVVVFGDLQLGPDARIGGEVVCIGGTITRDPGAIVKGGVKNIISTKVAWLRAWLRECFLKARPLAFGADLGWAWMLALGCLAFYALAALLFRTGVEKCMVTLETRPGFSVLTALLTTLITPVLTVLLVATGVGIIVVPFIGAGLLCATLFGKVVILAWLGRRITRLFGDGPLGHVAVAVIVGGLIVLGLYTVPVLGFLLFKLLGWIGVGVVVYTLVLGMKREKPAAPPPSSAGPSAPAYIPPVDPTPAPAPEATPVATPETAPTSPMMASGVAAMSSGFVGSGATAPVTVDVTATEVPSPGFTSSAGIVAGEPTGVPPFVPPPAASVPPPVAAVPPAAAAFTPPPRVAPTISAMTLPRAGFGIRTGALLLDAILIGMVVGFTSDILPRFVQFNHGPGGVLIALAIYGAAMWKTKGTTIGGIVCGLKVVRLDDRPIDWPTAVVRALSCFLSLAVGGLGFLWVLFDNDRQSWHDKIAGTTVVRTPKGVSLL
jgi:uncharacterized RDD family membrane protein YckC